MNLKRAIGGPLLSIVFLLFFVYMAAVVQIVFDNYLSIGKETLFLGSISDSVELKTEAEQGLSISAQASISVWTDLSDSRKVIFSENEQRKLPIASVTKLMTALVVLENYDFSQEVTISNEATIQGTELELLKPGEKFLIKDLFYAILISSDNAASYALLEVAGKEKFIDLMNAKAKELELLNTSFANPSGLGLQNFSTVYDLEKLTEYILKNHPLVLEITIIPEFELYTSNQETLYRIFNTNKLLRKSSGLTDRIIGGKTGTTRSAGECLLLVVKSRDNNGYLINVVLNSSDRFGEMVKIIDYVDTINL